MTFLGDIEFVEGRSFSKTTHAVLRKCLGGDKQAGQKNIDEFLEGISIKPIAFFKDVEADWLERPFIGQHVFKVVRLAGYLGTEDDLWLAVTGGVAPYAIKGRAASHKKTAVTKLKTMVKSRNRKAKALPVGKK